MFAYFVLWATISGLEWSIRLTDTIEKKGGQTVLRFRILVEWAISNSEPQKQQTASLTPEEEPWKRPPLHTRSGP